MKEGIFKKLFTLIRYLADIERTSAAGRINILGMTLSLILAISLSLTPAFETLIRLIHPNIKISAPLLQIFIIFCLFTLVCASMVGYLDGPRGNRSGQAPADEQPKTSDASSVRHARRTGRERLGRRKGRPQDTDPALERHRLDAGAQPESVSGHPPARRGLGRKGLSGRQNRP